MQRLSYPGISGNIPQITRSDDPGSGSRHGNAAGLPELTGGRSRLDRDTGERACLADGVSQRGIRIVRKEDLAHSAVGKCPAELLDYDRARLKAIVLEEGSPTSHVAIVARAIGIPLDMFPVMFAIGRMPGWIANWREVHLSPSPRIYRPRQIYVGPTLRSYTPIEQRVRVTTQHH